MVISDLKCGIYSEHTLIYAQKYELEKKLEHRKCTESPGFVNGKDSINWKINQNERKEFTLSQRS